MKDNEFINVPFELIVNDLEGTLTEEERIEFIKWRSASRANEKIYDEFATIYRDLELLPAYQKIDPDISWKKLQRLIENTSESGSAGVADKVIQMRWKWLVPVAASLMFIIWFSWNKINRNERLEIYTISRQNKKIKLPDGTEIFLNQNTKILYDANTYEQNRTVELINGEAFFNVIHNKKAPFKIKIDKVDIADIGTSFNVRKENNAVIVVVSSGIVSMASQTKGWGIKLTANQKGIYDLKSERLITLSNDELNYKAWLDKDLKFIDASLQDVVKELEATYKISFTIDESSLKTKKITASFDNLPIDSVLKIITQAMQIKVEKRDGTIHLMKGSD